MIWRAMPCKRLIESLFKTVCGLLLFSPKDHR